AEQQRGSGIDVDEDLLDRNLYRALLGDYLRQAIQYGFQTRREFTVWRPDASAGDIGEPASALVDNAETGDAQSRIDPEDAHQPASSSLTAIENGGGIDFLHVVDVFQRVDELLHARRLVAFHDILGRRLERHFREG